MSQQRPRTIIVLPNSRLSYSDDAYLRERLQLEIAEARTKRDILAVGQDPEKPRSSLTSDGRPIFPRFAEYDDRSVPINIIITTTTTTIIIITITIITTTIIITNIANLGCTS